MWSSRMLESFKICLQQSRFIIWKKTTKLSLEGWEQNILTYFSFLHKIYREAVKTINQMLKLLQTSNVIYNVFIYARMHETFRKQRTCLFPGYVVRIFSRRNNMMLKRKRKRPESVVETCVNLNSEDSV